MVFQRGATSVAQNTQSDLTYEIAHLSSICAQPCVFTGPDAEAGALTYASVRVLLLRAIEQQENMSRLYEMVQNLNQETRTSISSCLEELSGLRNHVGTLQQNIHEVYSALQSHGHRLDNLESITRSIGTIDSVLSSLEQRIQSNANAIGHLDQQQRDLALHMQGLPTSEMIERRMRELNDLFMQRLAMLERTVQDVQTQKADYNQVPSIVMSQLQTSLAPIETDVNALYNLWDLNKNDVHNTVRMGVQNRVQLVHSTPPFTTLMEMLRSPDLPTVTVGPAMMGGSTNISVTSSSFNENYGSLQLSPRTATTYQQQSSYLGIEVGPGSDSTNGVVVTRVLPGTPASAAGLRVGDILVAMNDRPFNTVSELVAVTRQCLAAKPAGGCYLAITRVAGTSHEKVNVWVP